MPETGFLEVEEPDIAVGDFAIDDAGVPTGQGQPVARFREDAGEPFDIAVHSLGRGEFKLRHSVLHLLPVLRDRHVADRQCGPKAFGPIYRLRVQPTQTTREGEGSMHCGLRVLPKQKVQ